MVLSYSGAVSLTRGSLEENLRLLYEAGGGLEEERRMSRSWNVGNILLCKDVFHQRCQAGEGGGNLDQRNCCPRVLLDDRSVEQAAAKQRGTVSVDDRAYTLRITQDRQE